MMKTRVTAKKYGGDDAGSWAVFLDGRPAYTGLTQREIPHYKSLVYKQFKIPEPIKVPPVTVFWQVRILSDTPKKPDKIYTHVGKKLLRTKIQAMKLRKRLVVKTGCDLGLEVGSNAIVERTIPRMEYRGGKYVPVRNPNLTRRIPGDYSR